MLQVANETPFTAALSVFPDPAGVETAYAVVKATFNFGAEGPELAKPQLPLLPADVFWGDPLTTSLRAAGEFALLKPATDLLLVGRAIAPQPDTRVADVTLSVGPVSRTVRIFGDRQWRKSAGRWRATDAAPWQRMPLRWEFAYGGVATPRGAGEVPGYEPRNPVGRGFVADGAEPEDGQPLPNLEDPRALITEPHQRPVPAGFGPIAPTWMPRRAWAGTYDETWTRRRAPYLPLDFDARFFHVAPPEQVAPGFLQGGEAVVLAGCTAGGPLRFALPDAGLELEFDFDGAKLPRVPQMETVLFEPDAGRLQMLWRAALRVDKKLLKLRQVVVRSRTFGRDGQPRPPLGRAASLGAMPAGYAATAVT